MALFGSRLCFLLLSFTLLTAYSQAANQVSISAMRTVSEYLVSKVVLICASDSTGSSMNEETIFYRRLGTREDRVIANLTMGTGYMQLSFDLTPEIEGYYFCRVGGTKSTNEVELVAYPTIAPEIRALTAYSTPTGDHAIIHCPYIAGALLNHYSVSWFRGLTPIDLQDSRFSRFSILKNFSLVINNTVPDDAKAYACSIEVNIDGDFIRKYAPAVSLDITDPIRITQDISDVAIRPYHNAMFTCRATGVPQPQIKWLISGVEVQGDNNPIVSTTLNSITVQSSLTLTRVNERQTGSVSCVAYHSYGGEVFMATSTANLVVLTNNFNVSLTSETNNVRVRAMLPTIIPGVFSLIIRFIFNTAVYQPREFIHPSFKNTKVIDFLIQEEQLPQFKQFGVRVALKYDNVEGDLTPETDKITLLNELPSVITGSECECPLFPSSTDSPASNTITYALISVFIVLLVLLLGVGAVLVGICVHYMYKKEPSRAATASPVYYHSGDMKDGGTLTRSISRASYNSESSRSSGRSSRSSGSRRSSRSGHSSHSGSSRAWSQSSGVGDLKSVKEDYPSAENDSLRHKELSQWGGATMEKESISSPDLAPVISPYEEAEFKPPQSREEVFHTSLPHASNPIQFTIKYEKKKFRHSDSSYEDMELEDFSKKVPFRTK